MRSLRRLVASCVVGDGCDLVFGGVEVVPDLDGASPRGEFRIEVAAAGRISAA